MLNVELQTLKCPAPVWQCALKSEFTRLSTESVRTSLCGIFWHALVIPGVIDVNLALTYKKMLQAYHWNVEDQESSKPRFSMCLSLDLLKVMLQRSFKQQLKVPQSSGQRPNTHFPYPALCI